ncbi:MAG: type IV pili methyl-accepting chemotaxis transducer N-terminal domain-containing protein [Pseudomonadota bacterium]
MIKKTAENGTGWMMAAALAASLFIVPAPAAAQSVPVSADTISKRIDLAGRQRMLAERMAAHFCYARSQIDTFESLDELKASLELFHETHTGFKRGNDDLNLFVEENASVLKAWSQVNLLWVPLKGLYEQILNGEFVTEEDYALANGLTLEVRARANDMVAQLRAAYAEDLGGDGFGDALLIDLYGRQRMLSQKLSKEVCLVAGGFELDTTQPELEATLRLFERSLGAFVEGLPVAGVPKPPTQEIADQLSVASDEWEKIGFTAQTIVTGGSVGLNDLATFRVGSTKFLREMNKAVQMLAALNADPS